MEIKNILVPIDFSDVSLDALKFAGAIASAMQAEIEILHVMETYKDNTSLANLENYEDALRSAIEKKLIDFRVKHSNLWGIQMTTELKSGKIHKVIQDEVHDKNIDLVVMGTHGSSGLDDFNKFILGSNAYRTVNISSVPVITIKKASDKTTFKNILLPLDITKSTTKKVDMAIDWAKKFGSTIHIVSVIEFFDEFRKNLDDMHAQLDEVADKIEEAGVKCTTAMLRNKRDVARAVVEYSEELDIDLIIIMTRQENLIEELVFGTHSRKVISQSRIPVLSVRPQK